MKTTKTSTGWEDTEVIIYKIKLCKAFMKVANWNNYNVKNPNQPYKRFICGRCKTFWSSIPGDEQVVLCLMEKGVNQCICEACLSEIDQSLVLK